MQTPAHADWELSIANVVFALESQWPLRAASWGPVYAGFLRQGGSPTTGAALRVTVRDVLPIGLARARPLFDGDRTWSALADGGDRYFLHAPHGLQDIQWAAHLPASGASAEIGCGPALVHRADDGRVSLECPLRYPLDQLLLMYWLAARGGLLIHAAGVVINDGLYLLAGRSGAGKSTLSRLLVNRKLGVVLSDDRLVLRKEAGTWRGYGTPWPGTERIARPSGAALAGLLFLEHGAGNIPARCETPAAFQALLPLVSILWHEREFIAPMTDTAAQLVASVPTYRFAFTPDDRAVDGLAALVAGG